MVQSIDFNRPVYNAVNIRIRKPEVNAGNKNDMTVVTDNGIYNAVKINIDNPSVNTEPKKCDYPTNGFAESFLNPIPLPQGFPVASAYYEASMIIPKPQQEEKTEEVKTPVESEVVKDEEAAELPPPNYTTTEAEKGIAQEEKSAAEVQFKSVQPEKKTPEIIPSEPIKPDVDIALVRENLESENFDTQAQQIEEIARVSLDDSNKAIPYIVKDVFTSLIEIVKKDTSKLDAPTEKQVEIRKKIIANIISAEMAKEQNKPVKVPYELSEEEIKTASEISPMEQAERTRTPV